MELVEEIKEIKDKNEFYDVLMKLANRKEILVTGVPGTVSRVMSLHYMLDNSSNAILYHYKKTISFFLIKKTKTLEKILQINDIWETIAVIFSQEIEDGCAVAQLKFQDGKTPEYSVNGLAEQMIKSIDNYKPKAKMDD